MDVNCLLKALAMSVLRVRVVELKVMGWLGGVWRRLPESVLRREKYCEVLYLLEHDSTVCIHVCLLVFWISWCIWSSSVRMCGSLGKRDRSWSRCRMSSLAVSERLGIMLGMWPRGICFLDAWVRMWRNCFSPTLQEEGRSRRANASSVSRE